MGRPRKEITTTNTTEVSVKSALTPQQIVNNHLRLAILQIEALPITLENLRTLGTLYGSMNDQSPKGQALEIGYQELAARMEARIERDQAMNTIRVSEVVPV